MECRSPAQATKALFKLLALLLVHLPRLTHPSDSRFFVSVVSREKSVLFNRSLLFRPQIRIIAEIIAAPQPLTEEALRRTLGRSSAFLSQPVTVESISELSQRPLHPLRGPPSTLRSYYLDLTCLVAASLGRPSRSRLYLCPPRRLPRARSAPATFRATLSAHRGCLNDIVTSYRNRMPVSARCTPPTRFLHPSTSTFSRQRAGASRASLALATD